MTWSLEFFITSLLLGVGLAMDAFSVSLANGLNCPEMCRRRMCFIAGIFAFFQALMPLLGWICVHTVVRCFAAMEKLIPWIALALLGYIGVTMLLESRKTEEEAAPAAMSLGLLLTQGIATSIDALSVGFTIAEYNGLMALVCAALIAVVTFFICLAGLFLGRKFGTRLAGKASVLGGVILIAIGLEIWITGVF